MNQEPLSLPVNKKSSARDDQPIVSSHPQRNTVEIHEGHYDAMCDEIDRLRENLPPCPTCGGTHAVKKEQSNGVRTEFGCPDCADGKVSIERLVATWRVLWGPGIDGNLDDEALDRVWRAAYNNLRNVKPRQ